MPVFVIFVEGADTEPAKLPIYVVESEEHASLLCEGMKEGDYAIFDFSFQHCTHSDRGKFAVWATMIRDARKGVYGNIVGGIHDMIDGAYSIMSARRSREKIASGADTGTGNAGSPPTGKTDEGEGNAGADTTSDSTTGNSTTVQPGGIVFWAKYPFRPRPDTATYTPTASDCETVRTVFPDADEASPPWAKIKAKLLTAGLQNLDWENLEAEACMEILRDLLPSDEDEDSDRSPLGFQAPPTLAERDRLVLQVLFKAKAFDSDHRLTTKDIAVRAIGKHADENSLKEVVAKLTGPDYRYVETKEGRGGGVWLTEAGRERAEKL